MANFPLIINKNPKENSVGNVLSPIIEFALIDNSSVDLSTFDAYVDGTLVYSGGKFHAPCNGPLSSVVAAIVDGYDAHNVILDYNSILTETTDILVRVSVRNDTSYHLDNSYTFKTGATATVAISTFEMLMQIDFVGTVSIDNNSLSTKNYQLNNGIYTRLVEQVSSNSIRLWFEQFEEAETIILTFSSDITDAYGGEILNNPISLFADGNGVFQSAANISNTNGFIKTWRESNLIMADSERIYLAGTKGIDVFLKTSEISVDRRGYFFSSNNIKAMALVNYPNDLEISDIIPPFLSGQIPASGGTAVVSDPIIFDIEDAVSTIEVISTFVSINAVPVFSGTTGWLNDYSGSIVVSHKKLSFNIIPATDFTSGTYIVRIIAYDLESNSMDTSYSFTVL